MADVEFLKVYRNAKYDRTTCWLLFASRLIAFINTYGPLYDNNYFSLILNLNNIIEHYLLTDDSKIISKLTTVVQECILNDKTEEETFIELRNTLYHLPAYTVSETKQRLVRYKKMIRFPIVCATKKDKNN